VLRLNSLLRLSPLWGSLTKPVQGAGGVASKLAARRADGPPGYRDTGRGGGAVFRYFGPTSHPFEKHT